MARQSERIVALFTTTVASFLTPFMGSAVNIALPQIGREFNMDAIVLSWVPTVYLLTAAMLLVPMGRISDIWGRRRIFLLGIIVYTLASFFIGLTKETTFFISWRIFQGIGGAMLFSTSVAILTSVFPVQERGRALGINVAGVYLGLSVGPFLGGILTHYFTWRSIFYLNALLGVLIFLFVIIMLKVEFTEAKGESFDYLGSFLYALMLFFTMYGITIIPGFSGFLFLIAGILLFVAFLFFEMGARSPIFDIQLFKKNTVFAFSNLAALINYSATNAVGFLLSLYLQFIKNYSPQKAGTILVAQPLVMAIFSPLAGRLSDKTEPCTIASLGMSLTAVGLFLFGFLKEQTSVLNVIANLLFLGFGFALFSSPNTNAVMSSVERKYYGVGSSTLATMRLLGQMFSMGFVMLLLTLNMGRVKITPEHFPLFLKTIRLAFFVFTGLCIIGIYASLKRGRVDRQ
uniref:MFS transporter n=1 Tax=candidate division WOR-3 bacterium TaxID=2052148 RepID=A0A7C4X8B8_UNCW3